MNHKLKTITVLAFCMLLGIAQAVGPCEISNAANKHYTYKTEKKTKTFTGNNGKITVHWTNQRVQLSGNSAVTKKLNKKFKKFSKQYGFGTDAKDFTNEVNGTWEWDYSYSQTCTYCSRRFVSVSAFYYQHASTNIWDYGNYVYDRKTGRPITDARRLVKSKSINHIRKKLIKSAKKSHWPTLVRSIKSLNWNDMKGHFTLTKNGNVNIIFSVLELGEGVITAQFISTTVKGKLAG